MTWARANSLKTGAFAALLGLAGLAATTTAASAHYTTTRCDRDGDRCVVLRCDNDGDRCYRIRAYHRYRHRYHHYGRGYYYGVHRRHWVCDDDGDRCRRVRYHDRPAHIGIWYRWGD